MATNPLTGQPLAPGQVLVTGPAYTGPRQTVVTPGGLLPPWIDQQAVLTPWGVTVNQFVDNGKPGGTYQPGTPQFLPDLTVTAPAPGTVIVEPGAMHGTPWIFYGLLLIGLYAAWRGAGSQSWQ